MSEPGKVCSKMPLFMPWCNSFFQIKPKTLGKVDDARNARVLHTVVRFACSIKPLATFNLCPQELRRSQTEERQKRFRLTSTDSMAEGALLQHEAHSRL
jgi:hypothetical protein